MSEPSLPLSQLEIVPFAIGDYVDTRRHPPFDADAEAAAITTLFTDQIGGTFLPWDVPPARRDLAAVADRLTRWALPHRPRCSVLVWIGHGTSNDIDAALFVPGGPDAIVDQSFTQTSSPAT